MPTSVPTLDDLSVVLLTLELALLATLLLLPVGTALAFLLARKRFPGRAVVETLVALPLVLPPTAIGVLLLVLLEPNGPLGAPLATLGVEVAFTRKAVVLATSVMALPLLVRSARTAFESIDPELEAVARTLGHSPLAVFRRVTLPLAWRGLSAGTLLAFCRALGEFGATRIVAGSIPGRTRIAALAIFQRSEANDDPGALRLVWMMTLLSLAIVGLSEALTRRRARREAR